MPKPLPKYRRKHFLEFLASDGCGPEDASPAHKIRWLGSLVGKDIHYSTLYTYAGGLTEFGPRERADENAELVRAFLSQFIGDRRLKASQPPTAAMPAAVYEQLIQDCDLRVMRAWPSHRASSIRLRVAIKVVRSTGIHKDELHAITGSWLTKKRQGYELDVPANENREGRTIPIPFIRNKSLCAATELETWLGGPLDHGAYLIPHIENSGEICWGRPSDRMRISGELRRLFASRQAYTLRSMRISFLERAMAKLGPAMAFYLSGYNRIEYLYQALRGQPKWSDTSDLLEVDLGAV